MRPVWGRLLGGKKIWQRHTKNERILEFLSEEYTGELLMAARLRQGAERMHYPQFREKMMQIAAEEEKHAEWLRGKILALGGLPPEISPERYAAKNSWECLLQTLKEERRCSDDLLEGWVALGELDKETHDGLRAIHQDERIHRDLIQSMLMRSDAYAQWPE